MTDPLGELEESLAYMFTLQTESEGKYIRPVIQKLRQVLDNYKRDSQNSFDALIVAIKRALPTIENYVDSYTVKRKMEELASAKKRNISWDIPSSNTRDPKFQFSAQKNDFISWLSSRSDNEFDNLSPKEQVKLLLEAQVERDFTTKLGEHLRCNPDFLSKLVTSSLDVFVDVMNSRIGFQLELQQIAKAIYHHSQQMEDNTLEPIDKLNKLIDSLDKKLVEAGYNVKKLLAMPIARVDINKSRFFRLQKSTKYRAHREKELLQPIRLK